MNLGWSALLRMTIGCGAALAALLDHPVVVLFLMIVLLELDRRKHARELARTTFRLQRIQVDALIEADLATRRVEQLEEALSLLSPTFRTSAGARAPH